MATKIRLARHGKKGYPVYHVVVADSRSPRDGKFIEKLGTYNPNTNPATIELNFESALRWIGVGAQPTDTARAILSYKGIMHMHHLLGGVKKGAFTMEQAEERFATWAKAKEAQIDAKRTSLSGAAAKENKERLANEAKVKEAKAAILATKLAEAAAAAIAVEAVAEEAIEEVIEAAAVAAE